METDLSIRCRPLGVIDGDAAAAAGVVVLCTVKCVLVGIRC